MTASKLTGNCNQLRAEQPRVSVCIPTYNMGRYLKEAIDSVLAQTFDSFELIVSDNCSTDDTRTVVGAFRDPRVHYYVNEENLGMYPNFNRAAQRATGEFLKFLCADDWLEPEYLERTVDLMDCYPCASIATVLHRTVDDHCREVARHASWRRRGPAVVSGDVMFRRGPWHHNEMGTPSHVLMRRDVFRMAGGFDVSYTIANDWEMWLRMFQRGDAVFARDYLVVIRAHSGQSSQGKDATLINACDTLLVANKHFPSDWWRRQMLIVRSGEVYFWNSMRKLLSGEVGEAVHLLRVVSRDASWVLWSAYVLFHFPFWCLRGIRRRYSKMTGGVLET